MGGSQIRVKTNRRSENGGSTTKVYTGPDFPVPTHAAQLFAEDDVVASKTMTLTRLNQICHKILVRCSAAVKTLASASFRALRAELDESQRLTDRRTSRKKFSSRSGLGGSTFFGTI